MTILAFNPSQNMGTNAKTKHVKPIRFTSERWIGGLLCLAVLGICCAAAFTGGLSISAGDVEMKLTGSLSQGMHLHFAAITG